MPLTEVFCNAGTQYHNKKLVLEGNGFQKEKSKEHLKRGPAFKLTARQGRQILRAVVRLREREANFSSKKIMQEAGVSETEVSVRTVQHFLNSQGYHYLKA